MKNLMNVTQKFTGLEMEVSYAWEYHLETFWSQNDGPDHVLIHNLPTWWTGRWTEPAGDFGEDFGDFFGRENKRRRCFGTKTEYFSYAATQPLHIA